MGSTSITRKGQLTIPARIRELLGLRQGDRVDFIKSDDRVVIQRGESTVAKTAGIVKTAASSFTAKQLREEAEQAIAEATIDRSSN